MLIETYFNIVNIKIKNSIFGEKNQFGAEQINDFENWIVLRLFPFDGFQW